MSDSDGDDYDMDDIDYNKDPAEFRNEELGENVDAEDADLDDEAEAIVEETEQAGKSFGAGITKFIATFLAALAKLPLAILIGITKPIPGLKTKLWKGLTIASLRQYHRNAGGDRLGLEVQPSGELKLTPVKYRSADAIEQDEQPGWKAKGRDKTWRPTTLGQDGYRLGKVPVVPLDTDSWRATSVLESRVAEAVDMGETRPLYDVEKAELTAEIDYGNAAGNNAAVADGGANLNVGFEPTSSPVFEDTIIDLGSDDWDGQAVSWEKSKELMLERTGTEEMQNQETRGEIAGQSGRDMQRFVIKVMMIAAGMIALAVIGREVVSMVFAGGGGGGEGASGGGGGGLFGTTVIAVGNIVGW